MFRNRKMSLSGFATIVGAAVLIILASPFSATAEWPWDDAKASTSEICDSPWDEPCPPPTDTGLVA